MPKSTLITAGLAAAVAVTTAGLIAEHNQVVAGSERLAATDYQLKSQQAELQVRTERLQAQAEQMSAANPSKQNGASLASQTVLPDVVVSASRF